MISEDFKNLVLKEFRRQRTLLVAGIIFSCCPYLLFLFLGLADYAHFELPIVIFGGSQMAIVLSGLMACLFAGNGLAGERPARSLEFLSYLPVSRAHDLLSRLAVAAGLSLGLMAMHGIVFIGVACGQDGLSEFFSREFLESVSLVALTVLASFGVSWLVSMFSRNPVIATASGMIAVLMLALLGQRAVFSHVIVEKQFWRIYSGAALTIGLLGFVAGCVYHLRRKVLE